MTSHNYTAWVLKPGSNEKYKADEPTEDPSKPRTTKKAEATDHQPLDPYEEHVLDYFSRAADPTKHQAEYFEQRAGGRQEYQYFQPIRLRQQCMGCHQSLSGHNILGSAGLPNPNPPQVGDLLGVVEIVLSDADTQTALNKNRAIFIATAIITFFVAMLAAYLIVRYIIVKPLKHLRDVSDEVSRGNIESRAEIHTGDEFEELGSAFNKMLRHLVTMQDELRRRQHESRSSRSTSWRRPTCGFTS